LPKVFEIVSFWPGEIFLQRHISAFDGLSFHPKLYSLGGDYSIPTSTIQATDQKANLLPRFDGLNYWGRLKAVTYLWNTPNLWFDKRPWQNKLLLKFFNKEKPDLIHFHWSHTASRLAWLPLELKIPYTFSMRGHDVTELTFDPQHIDRLRAAILSSAGIHSVSDDIWKKAVKVCHLDENSAFHKTIYTTVPMHPLRERETQGNKKDLYTFISIVRYDWSKNLVGLLLAFKRLLDAGLNVTLIIVGDGEQRIKMSLIFWAKYLGIEEKVSFPGTLPNSEITELLLQSDGYIQSSISEGFSNALAEAMAFGLPVFATDVGGTREIVKDDINGYLLDVMHPEEWWQKLILVQDCEKMQKIIAQAWSDAQEYFSPKHHAEKFAEFYNQSIKRKR